MKRFMQDLGDLTGLDIAAAVHCAPARAAATRSDAVPPGAALARGALRWLGLAAAGDGRRRAGGSSPVRG
ncbi:hypothetical protein [Lichenibacterium dinghuense]|uniref:hypothetical protein n=1 Tax=Lichenibacterium dinghuense TaxID=2895977 RepID=UPI001F48406E|nr:hypothetical protein [Lichenibacterium sp. 6Y81]